MYLYMYVLSKSGSKYTNDTKHCSYSTAQPFLFDEQFFFIIIINGITAVMTCWQIRILWYFYCFSTLSYTSMSNGQKFIANIFIFTFILSTIVSMSINMASNYDCLLPGFKDQINPTKNNLQKNILHNCRQGTIIFVFNCRQYI